MKFLISVLIAFLITRIAHAQEIKVDGKFQTDSLKIGIAVPYSLWATYPSDKTIVFPDSTFAFDPFEIDHKKYFPTVTKEGFSFDSVVYYLTSFEIDSIQLLSLPVFVVNPADCTQVNAAVDTIFLQQMVKHVPDSVSVEQLPLKTNTAYQTVSWLLNYPLLLIIGGVILIILIIVWVGFGKRIKKHFIVRKLNKRYLKFKEEFSGTVTQLQSHYTTQKAEAALVLWKNYMEQLQASPYTKYTTKEIFQMVKDEKLANALKIIDRTIYRESQGLERNPLDELQEYTEQKFRDKVQEVRNG